MFSKIEWTDVTDNPIKVKNGGNWCRKISPGCANCYAETINKNPFFKGNLRDYTGDSPIMELDEKLINSWRRMRKTKKHFISSMTDIFGEWVPLDYQTKILKSMWLAKNQTFQILTKRPKNMKQACQKFMEDWALPKMPNNIWLGVSIENQEYLTRSDILSSIKGNLFWSCEPLLEDLGDITEHLMEHNIKWVIIGGESGKKARPFYPHWATKIINQCKKPHINIPVFLKQLGSNPYMTFCGKEVALEYRDRKGGDWNEWGEALKVREFPEEMQNGD